jgi:hypothetical protein
VVTKINVDLLLTSGKTLILICCSPVVTKINVNLLLTYGSRARRRGWDLWNLSISIDFQHYVISLPLSRGFMPTCIDLFQKLWLIWFKKRICRLIVLYAMGTEVYKIFFTLIEHEKWSLRLCLSIRNLSNMNLWLPRTPYF